MHLQVSTQTDVVPIYSLDNAAQQLFLSYAVAMNRFQ